MKPLSIVEIVKNVQAIDYTSSNRFATITQVSFDARLCGDNSLFVPLQGQTDGHDYVQQAVANGATVTFWSRPQTEAPDNIAVIFVDDTLEAFQKLARYYIQLVAPKVVAITGSNGKTTTKDMVAAVLATRYRTHKTAGNYNNEIGLPQTILDMPEDCEMLVLEMGMDGFGQIAFLSQLSMPDAAIITLIGDSHLAHLGSREGIATAKYEITQGLKENGLLVFPEAEPLLHQLQQQQTKKLQTVTIGTAAPAAWYVTHVACTARETEFYVNRYPNRRFTVPVIGTYNAQNALSALVVADYWNIPVVAAQQALSQFQLTANRTEWRTGWNGCQLLNDAYNASVTSMKAILADFSALPVPENGRRIVVLGDIREIGATSAAQHAGLAEALDEQRIAEVYLYGSEMMHLAHALHNRFGATHVHHFQGDQQPLIAALRQGVTPSDVVLLKSSYGTNLLAVVAALTATASSDFAE